MLATSHPPPACLNPKVRFNFVRIKRIKLRKNVRYLIGLLSSSSNIMDRQLEKMMKRISIKRPSDKVISRMRNGHSVRMMKGEGLDIMIKPEKIIKMAKKFMMGKGIQISLDPEEISANKEIEGCGIFGKKFDKLLDKTPGLKKAAYAVGSVAKPFVQEGIKAAEAMAIAYGVPPSIASKIGDTASQYVEDPESLQGKKGLRELKTRGLALGQEVADMGSDQMGMDRINVADIVKKATAPRLASAPMKMPSRDQITSAAGNSLAEKLRQRFAEPSGQGLYAGKGLMERVNMARERARGKYEGRPTGMGNCGAGVGLGFFKRAERSVMGRNSLIGGAMSPALQSQPYSANYQFKTTLGPFLAR